MICSHSDCIDLDQLSLFHVLSDKDQYARTQEEYPFDDMLSKTKEFYSEKKEFGELMFFMAKDDEITNLFTGAVSALVVDELPRLDNPSGSFVFINSLYVLPEYRNTGIASSLIKSVIDECYKKGIKKIVLESAENQKPLYRNLGFSDEDHYMVLNLN